MSEIDAPHREKHEIRGHQLIIETGELAKQSDGSALISYGDTVVLATAVASKRERKRP